MTAQVHENIILNGEKATMAFCPPLPVNDARIIELKDDEILGPRIVFSTACWRKYIGTWEIKDGSFYLVKIEGCFKLQSAEPIFADWVTCRLRIPSREILQYIHMGYESIFEQELMVDIEKGVVIALTLIDNRQNKVSFWKATLNRLFGES